MALLTQFFHLIRLTVIPIIFYQIRQVQNSAPKHDEEEGGEAHH